ncbi:FxsA family protein [Aureimonas sp. AU4]|uniref:FxsA family protein n=1 Tax=Aureimonas sp. AU4 TaxID=1638163 RepID=UPI0007851E7D|nr:FxsA family protein [Aureimonas sp. AU4]
MPLRFLPLLLLALPLAEIGMFIWVGGHIGVGWTLLLVVASVVVGLALLKRQTLSTLRRARAEARAGRMPEREIVHGALIALAGVLLVIPGFLSDIAGLLLFLPPVRDLIWRGLRSRVVVRSSGFRAPEPQRGPEIIELPAADFERRDLGDPRSPWRGPEDGSGMTRH